MNPKAIILLGISLSLPLLAQHDPGRNATRLLLRGQFEKAAKELEKTPPKLNSPISESEFQFVLTMLECAKGDADAAFGHAKAAVAAGLPAARFLAGPDEALQALYAHDGFNLWLADHQSPLVHGPMLGNITDQSVSIWVRSDEERQVTVRVFPEEKKGASENGLSGSGSTTQARDCTAVVTIAGLAPGQAYRYEVEIDGKVVASDLTFRTHPKLGVPAQISVAFGGGAGFTPAKERMWTTIGGHQPDALLLLGDNVYIDDPEHQVTQQYCYYRRQSQPEWRAMTAGTGVYTIYDDHDFGVNDCVAGPEVDTPEWKRDVWQTFRSNWVNPGYGGGDKQPGCWYDFTIADVHFIALDTRYYRDLRGGSMLGPVQKNWLLDTLAASKGTFKVIVSSVPWSPGVKGGSKDTWDGFPGERNEVFAFLSDNNISGVVLMSADRHRSDLRTIPRTGGYDLYEMMSSRLTNVHVHPLMQNAKGSNFIFGYNKDCSFGLVKIDTTANDPTLEYSIVNIDGETVESQVIPLSALGGPSAR